MTTEGEAAADSSAAGVLAVVSLGSNIDPEANMAAALRRLAGIGTIVAISRLYRTSPAAGASGPDFLNAAVAMWCRLEPAELRDALRVIEADLGRRRGYDKNAPRTIDLDIALYGDEVIDAPELKLRIPDPDIVRWPHVALPLADVVGAMRHPANGQGFDAIAAAMPGDGVQPLSAGEAEVFGWLVGRGVAGRGSPI